MNTCIQHGVCCYVECTHKHIVLRTVAQSTKMYLYAHAIISVLLRFTSSCLRLAKNLEGASRKKCVCIHIYIYTRIYIYVYIYIDKPIDIYTFMHISRSSTHVYRGLQMGTLTCCSYYCNSSLHTASNHLICISSSFHVFHTAT